MSKRPLNHRALTLLCLLPTIAVTLPPQAGSQTSPRKGFRLSFAARQESAPLEILSTMSTLEYFFEEVTVRNCSEQTVTSVTFGVLLRASGNAPPKPTVFTGRLVPTEVKGSQERVLQALVLPVKTAVAKASAMEAAEIGAQLGILEVEFEDGWLC